MARVFIVAMICGTLIYLAHMVRDWNVPTIRHNHHVYWEKLFDR